jgi:NADH-quinone oxidoreductase subunit A
MEQIAFLHILGSIVGMIILLWIGARISAWLRPHRAHIEKLTTYESGSEPVGHARGPINIRLYVIGLIVLLFEIETLLLFPWALVWVDNGVGEADNRSWSLYMAILGTFFILVLGLGLIYVLSKWKHIGMDSTSIIQPHATNPAGPVPLTYYEQINVQYASQSIQQPINDEYAS